MPFLDLPPELLTLIAEKVTPTELRTSVDHLLISKTWYNAALPVFCHGLDFSFTRLSAFDVERLPPRNSHLSSLMHEKANRLSIYLVGHPSKQLSRRPWHSNQESLEGDEDESTESEDWHSIGPSMSSVCRYDWAHEKNLTLNPWKAKVNAKLDTLAEHLTGFQQLEELSFRASSENRGVRGPRWDYLFAPVMWKMIANSPMTVQNLTLDTCGTDMIYSGNVDTPLHLCPLIAQHLLRFQRVRLRMRCICAEVFPSSPVETQSLKTLIVKLSLPYFPPGDNDLHNGKDEFDAKACGSDDHVHQRIIQSAIRLARTTPKLTLLRVSYRDPSHSGINLIVADCITRRHMHIPWEVFSYEDAGDYWDPWEENDSQLRDMIDARGNLRAILA